MLTETQLEKYADVLIWGLKKARESRFNKREIIVIRSDPAAVKLAEKVYLKLLEWGMHPVLRMGVTPVIEKTFYEKADPRQLVFLTPGDKELCEKLNGSIFLYAPESLTHLSGVDPKRIGKVLVARKPLREITERRDEEGKYGWTLCMYPTAELAKQAGLSMKQYEKQIVKACYLDQDDPVREWEDIYRNVKAIKEWMNGLKVKHFHVESENVDLIVTPGVRRRWIGISGHNIPSFEVFLSPDWRGTEGRYYANQPSFRTGNYVEGVRLTFKKGSVTSISADKGDAFAGGQIKMDSGAGRIGEFSLTDRRFSRIDKFMANTLFDENYGGLYGNCHVAVGSSYSDTYNGNPSELTKAKKRNLGFNDSALHWDLVNTEKKAVIAHLVGGGKMVFYENGEFRY
jgi:aminopeptidase